MPRFPRVMQKIFGENAGSQQIAQFGSLAAGSPTFTSDPATIQALSQFLDGWYGAIQGAANPAIEDTNALFVLAFKQLAYILQSGIPEWDDETTYYIGNVVCIGDQYGMQFVSLADNNTNKDPLTQPLWWRQVSGQIQSTKTSNFTLAAADNGSVFPCNTTSAAFNITLNTGGARKNFSFTIKDDAGTFGTNPVTIVRIGSESIEGVAANYVCNKPNRAYTFVCDGTDWRVTSTSLNTKPGVGEFIGESGTQTADANNATGLNVIGDTNSRYAQIIQQKKTTSSQSFGLLVQAGTSGSDIVQLWKNAAGSNLGKYRGDGILELIAGGIAFPATQIPSSDANVLDDYEEGTFTPTLSYPTPGSSSFTYADQRGNYTKIGNRVFFSAIVSLSAFSKGSASGTCQLSNLPFTAAAGAGIATPVATMLLIDWPYSNIPVSRVSLTNLIFNEQSSNAGLGNITDPDSNSQVYVTGSYIV